MPVGNFTLSNLRLLYVVKEINEGFPSGKVLRVAALDDVMSIECDEETAFFSSQLL